MYRGKIYWNFFCRKCFFPKVFRFPAEKLGFLAENYTHGCQIFILWVMRNIFRAKFLKLVFKQLKIFRSFREVSVTTSSDYFKGWQSCKKCLEVQTKEKFIPREKKHYFNFSKNLSEVFFAISGKLPAGLSKLQSTYIFKVLRKNLIFLKWTWFQPSSDFEMKKKAFSQNVLLRVHATKIHASREIFWGKRFLFRKVFFSVINFVVWVISLSFAKLFSQVCQTTDQRAETNKLGKSTWKNCFL